MSDVMARIAPAVGFLRGFLSIERHADGAIANGMDVNLKALAVEARDQPGEPLRLEVEFATAATAILVALQQRSGPGLDHAVLKDLDRSRSHAFAGESGAPFQHSGHLLLAFLGIRPQGGHDSDSELPGVIERTVSSQDFVARISLLDRDDAETIGQLNGALEPGYIFGGRRRWNPLSHEPFGRLAKSAGGLARCRVAFDAATDWVRRVFGDAGNR